jgi:anti-anti-sigma factor
MSVVDVSGDVDLVSGPVLTDAIKEAIGADGVIRVVIDLSRTAFLDSSGIAVLLMGRRVAENNGVDFQVRAAHGMVKQVLELTGVWHQLSGESQP